MDLPGKDLPAPLFDLGKTYATPGAIEVMTQHYGGMRYAADLLLRHSLGDWGDLDPGDKAANDAAVLEDTRILSAYGAGESRLWVITEAYRSVTVILLPDES